MADREWWFPELTDDAWVARIRADYPEETSKLDDDEIRDKYAEGYRYADQWDHLGDARDEYEKLADAYLELLKTHLTQPAQAVDVGALQQVANELACVARLTDHALTQGTCQSASERITRAIGNAQAEG